MSTLFSYFKKTPDSKKKTSSEKNNDSTSSVKKIKPQNLNTSQNIKRELKNGDVVWAKLEGYPYWPAMVCEHPSKKVCFQSEGNDVHVQFFGDPPSRDWIQKSSIKLFSEHKPDGDSELRKAHKQASEAIKMPVQERIGEYYVCEKSDNEQEEEELQRKRPMSNGGQGKRKRLKMIEDSDEEEGEDLNDSSYEPEKIEIDEDEDYESLPSDNDDAELPKKRKRKSESNVRSTPVAKKTPALSFTPKNNSNKENIDGTPKEKLNLFSSAVTPDRKKLNASINKAQTSLAKFASPAASSPAPVSANTLNSEGKEYQHLTLKFLKDGHRMDKHKRLHTDPEYDARSLYVPDSFLNSKEVSPGMKQWWLMKKDLFDSVVFFKLGKFYELYHMDAIIGVKELGLTFMKGKFAHCGFPEVAFARYSEVLVQRGYKVARVEQTETPQDMARRSAKVVRRETCAIISKGTRTYSFLEGQSDESTAAYLLAFVERPNNAGGHGGSEFGVCFVDTSTAKFKVGQFFDDRQCSRVLTMISQYAPVQVLYERGKISTKMQHIINHELLSAIKEPLSSGTEFWDCAKTLKMFREKKYFNDDKEVVEMEWPSTLQNMLVKGDSVGMEAQEKYQLAFSALGACTWYLRKCCIDHEVLSMKLFEEFVPSDCQIVKTKVNNNQLDQCMVLDGVTLTNLDITCNADGGTEGTLLLLLDHTSTLFGKRSFMQWICSPLCAKKAIDNRLDAVEDLMENASLVSEARALLKTIPDLERILRRIHSLGSKKRSEDHPDSRAIMYNEDVYSKKKIGDLLAALDGFHKATKVIDLFQHQTNFKSFLIKALLRKNVHNEQGQFPDLTDTLTFFKNAFDHKKAKETGLVQPKPGVVSEYDSAISNITAVENKLNDYLKQQKTRLGCPSIVYWGKGKNRYQMEIPESALRSQTPNDYELKSQKKGYKRYQSKEIYRLLAELEKIEEKRDLALKDTMRNIFHKFDEKFSVWEKAVRCLASLDCLLSLAYYSLNIDGESCRPEIVELYDENGNEVQPFFEMGNCRHPCMNQTNTGDLIPNDVTLGKNEEGNGMAESCLLITGPNMGGKSTLMRQAGVLIIMAQMGCYVPADKCRLTPVDRVFTRLGAHDRILHGESTFFVELSETSTIFRHATKHSLVLLDELGRGTATYDGTAIASAVLRELASGVGCRVLFSTHYHTIVDEYAQDPRIKLAHMACMVEAEEDAENDPTKENITFLYKLSDGACPKSYGFNAAKLAGIPDSIIKLAHEKAKHLEETNRNVRKTRTILNAGASDLRNLIACV